MCKGGELRNIVFYEEAGWAEGAFVRGVVGKGDGRWEEVRISSQVRVLEEEKN
jgi:hypothetical protein